MECIIKWSECSCYSGLVISYTGYNNFNNVMYYIYNNEYNIIWVGLFHFTINPLGSNELGKKPKFEDVNIEPWKIYLIKINDISEK